ncbi:bifunctional enoyl-CoA hydratase/phosphate acetyltransferase [Moorella sulfitireducens (nom. illeg.)]|uniref:bifunctional enoyl-CoA hydratase/phosphate acetyltransferase n=1 Tax=Neomoorella sulfitireducens TaxID=2972948 RepID=UPI0021AD01EB|nr:bifunctional enoyl-CoA hydratase/phosphate acetyltransferase [Moorella sulfitireducens]
MVVKRFQEILDTLKADKEKRRVAVVGAEDDHTLHAVINAWQDGLIHPVLLGNRIEIEKVLETYGQKERDFEIIAVSSPEEGAREAARMVNRGQADCIMKGKIQTGALMKVLLDKESDLRTGRLISLVALMEVPAYHKLFAITDVGIVTYPTLEQKKELIANAVDVFHSLGISNPKVGLMAAVEEVNPKMPETIDAATLKEWNKQGLIQGCIVEGPISLDLAVSKEAARIKGFESEVAGDVDIMVVPEIVAGNMLAKALIQFCGAKTAGVVVGARVPLVIQSRSASHEEKYLALALAALMQARR